ncbi:GMC family oxidoreductase [Romeria aff. gracilis LEGE 07310]|uniref:GMC family oxidoreductase n=1 Tax=Vasconcelosia minhoensis LEGE 07310 TaxID=915328 RepID=A0A8J7AHF9_9CYAN|nr:GMC family oxidoreductase [Romeria gracilis]MBE9079019.1 GMC family oxidoreductase [Romeria aff. gracilis LEGE 07310]
MADYDIIIIGSGAGGGTLAYALAPTGQQILIVERGDYIPREKANWDPTAIFLEQRYQIQEDWYDERQQPFHPEAYYVVGGNTKVYGAALQRMREQDFGELAHYDGVSPAWPFSYGDFEPYYTRAESLYKIHGRRGEDPTEPQMSADFPFPPFPHEPRIQKVADQLQKLGLQPFHATLSLNRDVENPHNRPCIRCDTCDPYPCLADAKADAQVTCVDPALAYDNVSLLKNAYVARLHTDASGQQVTQVEVQTDGETRMLTADRIVVSCGAINSAALLLRSASEAHPNGLANSSDQVGRNLMFHNHTSLVAVSAEPNPTVFQKTLSLHDFYFGGPDQDYPLGQIQLTGKAKWQRLKHQAPEDMDRAMLEYISQHSVDWWVTTEDLPSSDNRVTLTPTGDIQISYQPNNLKAHHDLIAVLEGYLKQIGFYLFWHKYMGLPVVWHQSGTCRMDTDPKTSVLDTHCRTHDVENLYVVDSSFFPAMGAVNPTLTIIANALRVGDLFKASLG